MKSPSRTVFEFSVLMSVLFMLLVSPASGITGETEPMSKQGPAPFADFDDDGSGFISEEEFYSTRSQHMAAKAEAGMPMKGVASAPSFADLDTDGDKQLSEEELSAGQRAHMQANQSNGMGAGCGKKGGQGMTGGKGRNMPGFEDIDTDGDDSISREEFAAHQASHHGKNQ